MLYVNAEVRPSKIHGVGLFAVERIPAGALISKWTRNFDQEFDRHALDELPAHVIDKIKSHGWCTPYGTWRRDADAAMYVNHSDAPNTRVEYNAAMPTYALRAGRRDHRELPRVGSDLHRVPRHAVAATQITRSAGPSLAWLKSDSVARMEIVAAKDLFMLGGCTPAKRGLPQRAGFRWHGGAKCSNCAACACMMPKGHWWTDDPDKVIALAVLIAKTPGEPELDLRGHPLGRRCAEAAKKATGQTDWLSAHERREEEK